MNICFRNGIQIRQKFTLAQISFRISYIREINKYALSYNENEIVSTLFRKVKINASTR